MEHEGKGLKAANAEGERISGFTVERQVGGLGSAGLKVQGADCTQSAVSEDGESVALMVAGSWMRLVSLLLKLQVDRKMEACLVAHESPAKDAAVQSSPTSRASEGDGPHRITCVGPWSHGLGPCDRCNLCRGPAPLPTNIEDW